MQTWKRKAVADGLKTLIPFRGRLRRLVRAAKPYATNPDNDIGLLGDSLRQVDALVKAGVRVEGATVVEIGTGWKPIFPLVLRLCGAERVITLDQERLLDLHQFNAALAYIRENLEHVSERIGIKHQVDFKQVCGTGNDLHGMLTQSGIDYRAPYNFMNLPKSSADIIVSRDVLEHIPEHLLEAISAHSRDVLTEGGHICHTIDMSDHWEHLDKTISRVNFLQYDGPLWRFAGLNPQNYQNRLRQYDYVRIFKRDFDVQKMTGSSDSIAMNALRNMTLCKRYADAPHSELAILATTIVARKRASRIGCQAAH